MQFLGGAGHVVRTAVDVRQNEVVHQVVVNVKLNRVRRATGGAGSVKNTYDVMPTECRYVAETAAKKLPRIESAVDAVIAVHVVHPQPNFTAVTVEGKPSLSGRIAAVAEHVRVAGGIGLVVPERHGKIAGARLKIGAETRRERSSGSR